MFPRPSSATDATKLVLLRDVEDHSAAPPDHGTTYDGVIETADLV